MILNEEQEAIEILSHSVLLIGLKLLSNGRKYLSKLIKKDAAPINIIRDIIPSFSNLSTVYFFSLLHHMKCSIKI